MVSLTYSGDAQLVKHFLEMTDGRVNITSVITEIKVVA